MEKELEESFLLLDLQERIRKAIEWASPQDRDEIVQDGAGVLKTVMLYSGPMDPDLIDDNGEYRWDVAERRMLRVYREEMLKLYQKWCVRLGLDPFISEKQDHSKLIF
jgi:hypothetical protein